MVCAVHLVTVEPTGAVRLALDARGRLPRLITKARWPRCIYERLHGSVLLQVAHAQSTWASLGAKSATLGERRRDIDPNIDVICWKPFASQCI